MSDLPPIKPPSGGGDGGAMGGSGRTLPGIGGGSGGNVLGNRQNSQNGSAGGGNAGNAGQRQGSQVGSGSGGGGGGGNAGGGTPLQAQRQGSQHQQNASQQQGQQASSPQSFNFGTIQPPGGKSSTPGELSFLNRTAENAMEAAREFGGGNVATSPSAGFSFGTRATSNPTQGGQQQGQQGNHGHSSGHQQSSLGGQGQIPSSQISLNSGKDRERQGSTQPSPLQHPPSQLSLSGGSKGQQQQHGGGSGGSKGPDGLHVDTRPGGGSRPASASRQRPPPQDQGQTYHHEREDDRRKTDEEKHHGEREDNRDHDRKHKHHDDHKIDDRKHHDEGHREHDHEGRRQDSSDRHKDDHKGSPRGHSPHSDGHSDNEQKYRDSRDSDHDRRDGDHRSDDRFRDSRHSDLDHGSHGSLDSRRSPPDTRGNSRHNILQDTHHDQGDRRDHNREDSHEKDREAHRHVIDSDSDSAGRDHSKGSLLSDFDGANTRAVRGGNKSHIREDEFEENDRRQGGKTGAADKTKSEKFNDHSRKSQRPVEHSKKGPISTHHSDSSESFFGKDEEYKKNDVKKPGNGRSPDDVRGQNDFRDQGIRKEDTHSKKQFASGHNDGSTTFESHNPNRPQSSQRRHEASPKDGSKNQNAGKRPSSLQSDSEAHFAHKDESRFKKDKARRDESGKSHKKQGAEWDDEVDRNEAKRDDYGSDDRFSERKNSEQQRHSEDRRERKSKSKEKRKDEDRRKDGKRDRRSSTPREGAYHEGYDGAGWGENPTAPSWDHANLSVPPGAEVDWSGRPIYDRSYQATAGYGPTYEDGPYFNDDYADEYGDVYDRSIRKPQPPPFVQPPMRFSSKPLSPPPNRPGSPYRPKPPSATVQVPRLPPIPGSPNVLVNPFLDNPAPDELGDYLEEQFQTGGAQFSKMQQSPMHETHEPSNQLGVESWGPPSPVALKFPAKFESEGWEKDPSAVSLSKKPLGPIGSPLSSKKDKARPSGKEESDNDWGAPAAGNPSSAKRKETGKYNPSFAKTKRRKDSDASNDSQKDLHFSERAGTLVVRKISEKRTVKFFFREDVEAFDQIQKWERENFRAADALIPIIYGTECWDYVLRYKHTKHDEERTVIRESYEKRLLEHGAIIEHEESSENHDIVFVKIILPFYALCVLARQFKLKMELYKPVHPLRDDALPKRNSLLTYFTYMLDLNEQRIIFDEENLHRFRFKTMISNGEYLILSAGEQPSHVVKTKFFEGRQRIYLAYKLITSTLMKVRRKSGCRSEGIGFLMKIGAYIDMFPIHEGNFYYNEVTWKRLSENSAGEQISTLRARLRNIYIHKSWFSPQPYDLMRDYFGEKVALYFVYLGFYNTWLCISSLMGIIVLFFGIIRILSTPDLKASSWNLLFDNELTPAYAVGMSIWSVLYLEFWKRRCSYYSYKWGVQHFEKTEIRRHEFRPTGSVCSPVTGKLELVFPRSLRTIRQLCSWGILSGAIMLIILFWYIKTESSLPDAAAPASAFSGLLCIIIGRWIFRPMCKFLTEWENYRTETEYEDSFLFKVWTIEFFNIYLHVIYSAFLRPFVRISELTGIHSLLDEICERKLCSAELTLELLIIFIGDQLLSRVTETLIPNMIYKCKSKRKRGIDPTAEVFYPQHYRDEKKDDMKGIEEDYFQKVIQYGYVRTDSYKMLEKNVLDVYPNTPAINIQIGTVVVWHVFVYIIWAFLMWLVPNEPEIVHIAQKREDYLEKIRVDPNEEAIDERLDSQADALAESEVDLRGTTWWKLKRK
ncbi:hypothetical protein HDU97_005042 [Phlyctochytrium planicorne]|nr:hypothetical protein HDU97_005042 [Phlyctochytrium planicorne]